MSTDIMIDLETTGTSAGCCVLAIGACTLDGQEQFYQTISHQDALRIGLVDSPGTMSWWGRQSQAAREEAFSGHTSVIEALGAFSDWLRKVELKLGEAYVWGNGADFDLPILQAVYEQVGMVQPWKPFNGRCYRTLKNLPQNKGIKPEEFVGIKHTALSDALHQAHHMLKILRETKQKDMFVGGY